MKTRAAGLHLGTLLFASSFFSTVEGQQSGKSAPPQSSKPESVYAEIGKAPERARAGRNPLEKDPEAVAAGRILLGQRCAECHGDSAEGGKKRTELARRGDSKRGTGRDFLDSNERSRSEGNARVVEAARATALAACQLHQVAGNCFHKRRQRRPQSVAALSVGQFAANGRSSQSCGHRISPRDESLRGPGLSCWSFPPEDQMDEQQKSS
jgi:mono/diheme cytochrome c family protein